jgi:hypothetical protein
MLKNSNTTWPVPAHHKRAKRDAIMGAVASWLKVGGSAPNNGPTLRPRLIWTCQPLAEEDL